MTDMPIHASLPPFPEHCIKRVKTAACGTELEGLVLVRTLGVQDTLAWYARLTKAITATYAKRTLESLQRATLAMASKAAAAAARQRANTALTAVDVTSRVSGGATAAASTSAAVLPAAAAGGVAGQVVVADVLPLFGAWNTRVTRIRAANDVGNVFGLMLCAVPGVCCGRLDEARVGQGEVCVIVSWSANIAGKVLGQVRACFSSSEMYSESKSDQG